MLALALGNNVSDGLLIRGYAYSSSWSWTIGAPLYLVSGTAGAMSNTAPSSGGDVVRIVAYSVDAATGGKKIYFNPDNSWTIV
jgi:hypothetical protein